mmetsp:Transcript_71638/g.133924  ORF Transcript_71638/g.133924 Transcript_71638/m.133924 type:complete len:223 (+) Transcript_71638:317-985(+)
MRLSFQELLILGLDTVKQLDRHLHSLYKLYRAVSCRGDSQHQRHLRLCPTIPFNVATALATQPNLRICLFIDALCVLPTFANDLLGHVEAFLEHVLVQVEVAPKLELAIAGSSHCLSFTVVYTGLLDNRSSKRSEALLMHSHIRPIVELTTQVPWHAVPCHGSIWTPKSLGVIECAAGCSQIWAHCPGIFLNHLTSCACIGCCLRADAALLCWSFLKWQPCR